MVAHGTELKMGVQREALVSTPTWPATAPALVQQLIPVTQEALMQQAILEYSTTRTSRGSLTHADVVRQDASATATYPLYYEGFETLWALALGYMAKRIGGTVMPEQLAVGAYRHRFELDTGLAGAPWTMGDGFLLGDGLLLGQQKVRRATFAAYRGGVSVWEALSGMIARLTLGGSPRQGVTLQVDTLAHSVSNASAVNTTAVMDVLPAPAVPRILLHHGVLRIGPYSTTVPLDSTHEQRHTQVQITLDNRLTRQAGRRTGLYTEEPEREGPASITGSFTLPRYTTDTLIVAQRAGTQYMADLKYTGPQIGATGVAYQCNFYFPTIRLIETRGQTEGPGRIPVAVQFTAHEPAAAPAGFPAMHHLGAFVVEIISSLSTSPLL